MSMNEIIETEYREIDTVSEELQTIGAEIRSLTSMMKATVLACGIEIGKRFEVAKAKVGHGGWGKWCEEATGYSLSMAENYIKIYKEYGNEQVSLFGDFTKSESIANLSITKLLALTAVNPDEREEFVRENDITDDTTVKELQALIKEKEAENSKSHEQLEDAKKEIELLKEKYELEAEKRDMQIENLKAELEKMENDKEENTFSDDVLAELLKEAEEKARENVKKEIERVTKEKEKAEKKAESLDKKLQKLNESAEEKDKRISDLEENIKKGEQEQNNLQETIDKLRKEAELGSNENLVRLNLVFEKVQTDMSELKTALAVLGSTDKGEKLKEVIVATLSEAIVEL